MRRVKRQRYKKGLRGEGGHSNGVLLEIFRRQCNSLQTKVTSPAIQLVENYYSQHASLGVPDHTSLTFFLTNEVRKVKGKNH